MKDLRFTSNLIEAVVKIKTVAIDTTNKKIKFNAGNHVSFWNIAPKINNSMGVLLF